MNKREFIKKLGSSTAGVAALGALPALANASVDAAQAFKPEPQTEADRRRARFLNLPLATHDGRFVRFYDDLVKDKTVLINFMYTHCAEVCPAMTANLKKVQKELGDRVGKDIFMYSITLAPEHDTPEVLRSYAEIFKVGPGWTFLTGRPEDIEALRRNLGFYNPEPELDKDRSQHANMVRFGIERLQRWAGTPAMTNPKYIAEYVRWIEPRGSRPRLAELIG